MNADETKRLKVTADDDRDLILLMRQPAFRAFAHRILASCHVWSSVSHSQAMTAAALSARRDVGLALHRRLREVCWDLTMLMEQEHFLEQRRGGTPDGG